MPRRGENIYKRKDGRWEGRYIRSYGENGKAQYASVYGKTYTETKEKLTVCKVTNRKKIKDTCKLTVRELMELWLADRAEKVKDSSYACYADLVRLHICPELGAGQVRDMTAEKLEQFLTAKKKTGRKDGKGGLSAKTISDILFVLKSALKLAQRKHGFIESAEIIDVKGPIAGKRKVETFGPKETERMSKTLLANWNLENASVFLTLNTGIRLGELCGLRWADLDTQENLLRIRRTVLRLRKGGRTELVIQTPKSEQSRRDLPLQPELVELLTALRKETPEDAYMLSGTARPIDPRTVQYRFRNFLWRNRLSIHNFHVLRHSFASRCMEKGMDAKCLSEILGHANIKTTLQLYVHPSMAQKRNGMQMVSTLACYA